VPPGTDDVKAAELRDPLLIALVMPAEPDVGTAPGHLGRHGDRAVAAGLRDDGGLGRVVFGVEHDTWQALGIEASREPF